jgi:inorganic phosphate transporter, PiT family
MLLLLILLILMAVSFDFTNGFHDSANAVATSVATGALKPRQAVAISALFNAVGAFISISVATKIASGLISSISDNVATSHGVVHGVSALVGSSGLIIIIAALSGAIIWNLITWYFTLPSSSSHALVGGIIGAALIAGLTVKWSSLFQSVLIPAILSPFICMAVAAISTFIVYRLTKAIGEGRSKKGYRFGQIFSASLVSLAHGTNDAQKTMGVITLGLITYYSGVGNWDSLNNILHVTAVHGFVVSSSLSVPLWVKCICAAAMAAGTASGGWRIMNTMGNRITDVEPPQGFAAETASAAVILSSSYYGYPLSTTQVVSGGVMGSGIGRQAAVHWNVAGQMATGWLFTIPAAAVVGAVAWGIADVFGSNYAIGGVVVAILIACSAAFIYYLAKKQPITADDLDRTAQEHAASSPPPPPSATPAGAAV